MGYLGIIEYFGIIAPTDTFLGSRNMENLAPITSFAFRTTYRIWVQDLLAVNVSPTSLIRIYKDCSETTTVFDFVVVVIGAWEIQIISKGFLDRIN